MGLRLALCLLLAAPAFAQAVDRFPQPVRVGDLIGRKLIGSKPSQPLLGHVRGVDRRPDGTAALRIETTSLLPWGGRVVDVPIAVVALLGEHVALMDLTSAQLDALPDSEQAAPVPSQDHLRIGLVRPFH